MRRGWGLVALKGTCDTLKIRCPLEYYLLNLRQHQTLNPFIALDICSEGAELGDGIINDVIGRVYLAV